MATLAEAMTVDGPSPLSSAAAFAIGAVLLVMVLLPLFFLRSRK